MEDMEDTSRRRFLHGTGLASILALTGCVADTGHDPEDRSREGYDSSVPQNLQSCSSIDGIERGSEEIFAKDDVSYQNHPEGYQMCANCRFFCPAHGTEAAEEDSDLGACVKVEGRIRSSDWCGLYQATDRLDETPPTDDVKPPSTYR